MAILDKTQGHLVLRIVYTGPARSGKTETVRHLAQLLLGNTTDDLIYSPSEAKGRTLFFDWFDYQGGIFHDYKIRCQIISVPGQDMLKSRREQLLADADAVILVLDSRDTNIRSARQHFENLCDTLAQQQHPAALVIQANKQDIAEALEQDEIRQKLSIAQQIPILPSTATESLGIREAFIKAVSLSIATAEDLYQQGYLDIGSPSIDSGEDLLNLIKSQEQSTDPEPEPQSESADLTQVISFAESQLGAGFVWPPLAGRQLFRQLQILNPSIETNIKQHWQSHFDHWQLQADSVFKHDLNAKQHWIKVLKQYNQLLPQLAPDCAVFLLKAETGDWWLWHITRAGESLVEQIQLSLYQADSQEIAKQLLQYTRLFIKLYHVFAQANMSHKLSLDFISVGEKGLYFHGFLDSNPPQEVETVNALWYWHQQLKQHIPIHANLPVDIPLTLNALETMQADSDSVEVLSAWLIGE